MRAALLALLLVLCVPAVVSEGADPRQMMLRAFYAELDTLAMHLRYARDWLGEYGDAIERARDGR